MEEGVFSSFKELQLSGVLTFEDESKKEKKISADDIYSYWVQKSIDMNPQQLETYFVRFLQAWLESGVVD